MSQKKKKNQGLDGNTNNLNIYDIIWNMTVNL